MRVDAKSTALWDRISLRKYWHRLFMRWLLHDSIVYNVFQNKKSNAASAIFFLNRALVNKKLQR